MRDLAAEVVRIQNDSLAEMCGKYPDRFVAFASVALQFPDLAVQQLEHGVQQVRVVVEVGIEPRGAVLPGREQALVGITLPLHDAAARYFAADRAQ